MFVGPGGLSREECLTLETVLQLNKVVFHSKVNFPLILYPNSS